VRWRVLYICVLVAGGLLLSMRGSWMSSPPGDTIEYRGERWTSSPPEDTIEYRGERFKLTKAYVDYDDYKEDPNNIDPSENARIERAVLQAKISPSPMTQQQMISAIFDLKFPGFGLTSFGERAQPDGTSLDGFSVEVPRAGKDRVLVFRSRGDAYTLIDDFVSPEGVGIIQVRSEGEQLVYSSADGKQVLVRPLFGDQQTR
jgi:hypothetical protein